MNANEVLILNLEEVRRRSIIIWRGIPDDKVHWKPDAEAMSGIEMVRHVLEGELEYMLMLKEGKGVELEDSPFAREFTTIESEIEFSMPYHHSFLDYVKTFSPQDLTDKKVDRTDRGYIRTFGDFILRIAYHESIHAGQMLSYLRQMDASRPNIWD